MRGAVAFGRSHGFTLVELLVVMGLGGILLALLIPALQRTMETSKTARCASNLRHLGMEVLGFISENNGALPWYESAKGRPGMWWYRVFNRTNFEGFSAKMTCPSLKQPYIYGYSPGGAKLTGSYRYNKYMGYRNKTLQPDGQVGTWIYPEVRLQNQPEPSRIALLADSRYTLPDRSDDSSGFEEWQPLLDAHQNKTHAVMFCLDGHVEMVPKANPRRIVFPPFHLDRR